VRPRILKPNAAAHEGGKLMPNASTLGERLQSVRKRRGLTQTELAHQAGVSVSLIRHIEQGVTEDTRLETARKLAIALRVPTTALVSRPDADTADPETAGSWEPVNRALFRAAPQPDEPVTADGVAAAMGDAQEQLATNRYSDVRVLLPGLLRDSTALNGDARKVRSRVLNMTGWLMVQTRQWDSAEATLGLAIDAADDRLDAAAAVNTLCWSYLRQGQLTQARDLASHWADDIEPRFSRATTAELSLWGRLVLGVANAAVRDNRPGEADDALRLARAAADRIGREVTSDTSTTRTFGPVTVAMIRAENAAINDQPTTVLNVAEHIPADVLHPTSASRCRHRLDVANAMRQLRRYPESVEVLQQLRRDAPEWLVQQRYARDILGQIIGKRRTLTAEMRELADFIRVPY
jgi:transcriptional regulator with XRE-family HTH domain/alkylhydroperoxidase/carboxymuconolactone decarboxylase family protein YurZ